MGTLQLTRIMPNPVGKDAARGATTNDKLNQEWVEFTAIGGERNLSGDTLYHRTYTSWGCTLTGSQHLVSFTGTLGSGQSIRVHTGSGSNSWEGSIFHYYLGRSWFIWNNDCGDEAVLEFRNTPIDRAAYGPKPPERVLVRVAGTSRFY